MTTIQKNKYIFSVDVEKTREYYKTHSLCDCECCRNYCAQVKEKFPKLNAFLSEFGIDISRPDEACSVEMDNYIDYINVDYTVCGKLLKTGEHEIKIYDNLPLSIAITNGFASPNEQTGDYFTISVTQIKLPWVLEESFPQSITNEKSSKRGKNKFKIFYGVEPNQEDYKRLNSCCHNIKAKVFNNRGIDNFIDTDGCIAFAGSVQDPKLNLSLSIMKTKGRHYLHADIDNEISWEEWDFNNQDEFENAIVEFVSPLINRTVKTVIEKKKFKFIKTSRYYLSNHDKWILIDQNVIDKFILKLFIFKDSIREDIKVFKLQ